MTKSFILLLVFGFSQSLFAKNPEHSLTCVDKKGCPEGLAKLVVKDGQDDWKCTGFLVSENILATNRHCLTDAQLAKKTDACDNIDVLFAKESKFPAETVKCKKILSFSEGPSKDNVANLDYAFLELEKSIQRKAFKVSHVWCEGIRKTDFLAG